MGELVDLSLRERSPLSRSGRSTMAVRTLLGGKASPDAFVSAAGRGDGPLEGTDGRAGDRVEQALDGEASGGAREPARTAGDGRGFLDVEDATADWRGLPGKVSGQRV